MQFIGIDGCKSGWFFVALSIDEDWEIGIVPKISDLSEKIETSSLTLIDIPIGLRENDTQERLCDLSARKVLGKRRSSVFPAPSRSAINCSTYQEGSNVNHQCTGRKLSQQSWAIANKIHEIDVFLRNRELKGNVREMHPEVCFWALNNKTEMDQSKKTIEGINQRLEVLSQFYSHSSEILNSALVKYLRKEVAKDDIIDALVGAVTAKSFHSLETLPSKPEIDLKGLPMEMVYPNI